MAAMKRVSLSRRTVNLRSQSVAATQASRLAIRWHGNMESPDCSIAQNEPLSYRGARQLLALVVLLVIVALILRALESVLLLFAIVFLVAMVLNPIVV